MSASQQSNTAPQTKALEGTSLGTDAWIRLKKNRMAVFSLYYLIAIVVICIAGPSVYEFFTGISHETANPAMGANGPFAGGAVHPFGTDELGRDILVRTMEGGRVSLGVGILATLVSIIIGITYGAISGYKGGNVDSFMMRFVDILYGLPFTIFVILLTTVFGRSIVLLFIAIGAVEWLTMARIIRSSVYSFRNLECIEAARSLGLSNSRILFRHILPNVIGLSLIHI